MANLVPQSRRPVRQIQIEKKRVPLEQIIAVRGQSPVAKGIETAGQVLGQALARKAQLRRQGEQLAAMEALAGQQPGAFRGVPLEVASSLTGAFAKQRMTQQETEKKKAEDIQRIRLLEQQAKMAPGSLGDDFDAAKLVFTQNSITNRMMDNPNLDLRRQGIEKAEDDKFKNRLNNQKNRLINDPRIKPLHAQDIGLRQVGEIMNMVKDGNTVAAGALGVKMAKAMGEVGVLTDQDVLRYVQSGRLDRMAADKLSRMIRGVPSDATQAEIGQIASVLRDSFSEKIQPIYNEYIDQFSQVEGLTPDEVSKKMAIPYRALQPLPMPGQKKATHRWNPATGKVEPL